MNFEDYETLPTNNVTTHMTAGAIAGVMEHCVMYPLDSVKTRMQSLSPTGGMGREGVGETLLRMVRNEGIFRPVRGVSAMVVGAGPAHALYFSCYEYIKDKMVQRVNNSRYNTLIYGGAGVFATLLHDGVMNPAEVVKQRLQMYNSPYKSVIECMRKVYISEGPKAFYRSYTTQLTMNIPFQSIHFMTYEITQTITNKEGVYNPPAHMVSGAIAGAVAAAVTTPLDVCKTLLNTQQTNTRVQGMFEAIRTVYTIGGPMGFFKGLQARVLYQMPATAICWSTYEFFKYILSSARLEESNLHSSVHQQSAASENVMPARTTESSETLALKPRELPSMSGAGYYGTISFNTIHSGDTSTGCSGMRKGNSLLDIKHT